MSGQKKIRFNFKFWIKYLQSFFYLSSKQGQNTHYGRNVKGTNANNYLKSRYLSISTLTKFSIGTSS